MRASLLLTTWLLPLVLFAQSGIEQELEAGVEAYLALDFEAGELLLEKVSSSADPQKNPVLIAKAHCFLAECQYELDKFEDANANFLRAEDLLAQARICTDTLDFYYRVLMGKAAADEEYEILVGYFEELICWIDIYPTPSLEFTGLKLYAEGMINLFSGKYDLALSQLDASVSVQEPLGRDPFLAGDHSTLAFLYATFEDYYRAISHQQIASELYSPKRPEAYFRNLINLAGYQLDNRSLAGAQQTIYRAKSFGLANVPPDSEQWMMYYNLQRERHNTDLQLDSFAYYQAESDLYYATYPHYKSTSFYHDHLNYATGLAIRTKDFQAAKASVRETFVLFPPDSDNFDRVLSTLFLRSKVEIAEFDFEKGIGSIQILLSYRSQYQGEQLDPHYVFLPTELDEDPLVIEYLKDKASYYNQWDRVDTTKNWLELSNQTIQLADSLIARIKQSNNQTGLRKQLDEISRELRKIEVENYYRQYRRTQDPIFVEQALNASEQVKHLIISERLHENILYKSYGLPEELIEKERLYNRQLTEDLIRLNYDGISDSTEVLQNRVSKTRELQETLRARIEREYPRFAALRYSPDPLKIQNIKEDFIDEDEALLHFMERDSLLYLIGLTKDQHIFKRIRLSTPLAISSPTLIRQMENASDSVIPPLRLHYQEIMEPLEEFMGQKNLVIVPDAYLWHLPFPALITADAAANTSSAGQSYLIQEREIRHLFSLRVGMLRSTEGKDGSTAPLDLASFSPFTDQSLANYSKLADSRKTEQLLMSLVGESNSHYLSGKVANKTAFNELAPQANLLHIFSHAQVSEVKPDSSFLMLHPSTSTESLASGYLTTLDVYNTTLVAKLAVLAACKTGGGKYYQGQGIANLARAFAHAGCENLVVNLWESKAEAITQLLADFYPAVLAQQRSGSYALAEAQRNYIDNNPLGAHPGYWAMAIYIGDRDTFNLPARPWNKLGWVGGMALLFTLLLATLKFLKKRTFLKLG